MTCQYKLPDGTTFHMEWVGDDAEVFFDHMNREGEYLVAFSTRHQCITIGLRNNDQR